MASHPLLNLDEAQSPMLWRRRQYVASEFSERKWASEGELIIIEAVWAILNDRGHLLCCVLFLAVAYQSVRAVYSVEWVWSVACRYP